MANDTWIYTGSASWTTTADWSGGVPVSTSDVVVAQGNPLVTAAVAIGSLTNSAAVTFSNAGASTISGAVSNTGKLTFDGNSGQGGFSLAIGGVLTNTGVVRLGATNNSLSKSDIVQAGGLANSGKLLLNGGATSTAEALLNVKGAAGFGTAGVLTGSVSLSGNAEIEFASGSISKIASHSSLKLTGANAFIGDAGSLTSNSALKGLSANFGTLDLVNGAQVATIGALTNIGTLSLEFDGATNTGMTIGGGLITQGPVKVDAADGEGGSSLTINGVLRNTGYMNLGNMSLSQSSTVTATGLFNAQASPGRRRQPFPFLRHHNRGADVIASRRSRRFWDRRRRDRLRQPFRRLRDRIRLGTNLQRQRVVDARRAPCVHL